MKKRNLSKVTIALFAAAILLAGTGILGTRAAINSISPDYVSDFTTDSLDVTLMENGNDVAAQSGKLLTELDGKAIPGKDYDEVLQVRNTSTTDQFVRVIVRKYWMKAETDADGNTTYTKDLTKDPSLIILTPAGGSDWKANKAERTAEREVYYYTSALSSEAGENVSSPLVTNIKVDKSIMDEYATDTETVRDNTVTVYYYAYDGCVIGLEAEAQAVQTHSGADAVRSVWGATSIGVTVNGDTISVAD